MIRWLLQIPAWPGWESDGRDRSMAREPRPMPDRSASGSPGRSEWPSRRGEVGAGSGLFARRRRRGGGWFRVRVGELRGVGKKEMKEEKKRRRDEETKWNKRTSLSPRTSSLR